MVFNGDANQYRDHPIPVKTGEKVRVYLVNAGPVHFSAFHIVGTIFDHVWVDFMDANAGAVAAFKAERIRVR